jgi:hypothetical protein
VSLQTPVPRPRTAIISFFVLCLTAGASSLKPAEVTLTREDGRIAIAIDGAPFTEYVYQSDASRPYCYPILAADGTPLTRDFPQKDTAGEDHDHPWHRSLWFAHSMVNGVDFWNEGKGDVGRSPQFKGQTVTDGRPETQDGQVGVLRAHTRWLAPGGKLICTDDRTLSFGVESDLPNALAPAPAPRARFIDFDITIHALADAPLHFGDNKDGTMAMRLAQWMTLPHKYQKRAAGGDGHILTATGARDASAWGKRADWCYYYAVKGDKTYGVAIFDHPENFRHPTWWMARDYGLFGANPFGQHDYEHLKNPHAGDYTVPPGGALHLRYRFLILEGETAATAAQLNDAYAAYAHQ